MLHSVHLILSMLAYHAKDTIQRPYPSMASRTEPRIRGVLPSDVKGEKRAARFVSEGLCFEAVNLSISQKDLVVLANDPAKVALAAR